MATHTCPSCGGRGTLIAAHARMTDGSSRWGMKFDCGQCDGTGEISEQYFQRYERGQQMRKERLARGVGLRQEAERRGMSPGDLCQMESGQIEPIETGGPS